MVTKLIGVAIFCLLFAGCMTDAELRQERITQNYALFSQLSVEAQQHAQGGQVGIGDPTTAVWFARGEPDRKMSRTTTEGSYEVWLYYRTEAYETEPRPEYEYPPRPKNAPPGTPPPPPRLVYRTHTEYRDVVACEIYFQNGYVSAINQY